MYAIYGNIYHQYTPNVSNIYHTWIPSGSIQPPNMVYKHLSRVHACTFFACARTSSPWMYSNIFNQWYFWNQICFKGSFTHHHSPTWNKTIWRWLPLLGIIAVTSQRGTKPQTRPLMPSILLPLPLGASVIMIPTPLTMRSIAWMAKGNKT